ncbi:DUF6397 family protein [Streptomyces chromofuscus]|uniref:DUF6397 family protein n=1 Tax=Streptomyces chromofuscus TaxID=42881 RepID=UPI0019C87636|nr:hypothetical protein GCM10010254_18340 [Streptomyces chromofuscus]
MSGNTVVRPDSLTCTPSRAARELGLKRREFDLAVNLGRIRTVPDDGGGGLRVEWTEIERLRAEDGFPEALLDRVRSVSTSEAAGIMVVSGDRFTRLARLGLVVPVAFYYNRYRTLVWLYLAEELRQFAADEKNAPLLKKRSLPEGLRRQLAGGLDRRARNWRGRHLGFLLRRADDPWERAGALAALLDPVQIADIVRDPYERAHVNRFRPGPPTHSAPGSPTAQLAERIMTADDPDEISWLRADLAQALDEARAHRPVPRPAPRAERRAQPGHAHTAEHRPAPRAHHGVEHGRARGTGHRSAPCPTPAAVAARENGADHAPHAPRPDPQAHKQGRPRGLLGWLRRTGPSARLSPSYSARKSPSWTTDTSNRPSRS